MATSKHAAYTSAVDLTGNLTTANATTSAAGTAYNNSSNGYLFADLELVLATQGSARTGSPTVEVYMEVSYDSGTTYTAADTGYARPVAVFGLDAATTARRVAILDVPVPRGYVRFKLRNITGQTFATGTNLNGYFHAIEVA